MTIQEMKERKKELGYTNEQVSRLAGIPLSTVQKIFGGLTSAPRYETICKLENLLAPSALQVPDASLPPVPEAPHIPLRAISHDDMVSENAFPYGGKKQGEYTIEDYYALPDDQRAELIDGYFYDMATPSLPHQDVIGILHAEFKTFVRKNKGPCRVYLSPVSVQLDCDDKTMVEPDLIVICSKDKLLRRCCFGAPDLVIEVLSPSTRRKDIRIKTTKYEHAGVREYWMIDPDKKQVMTYFFEDDGFPSIYGFDAVIPVRIWDNQLKIDFREVWEEIAFFYEESEEE